MMFNPFSLNGKKVLITGASSGLGITIATDVSKMGADVIITARNKERLNTTYLGLEGEGNSQIIADLCREDDIELLTKELPILNGIVLCAGVIKTLPVKNINNEAIETVFQTNILSSIQLLSRLLKSKKLAQGASVIFISSVSTFNVKIGNSLYSASKGAVNSFAKAMALEVAKQKMRVNCIQPGYIPSGMLVPGAITSEQIDEYILKHPLGFGRPSDISHACIYFLSDASQWITGSILTVDGGLTLR